MQLFLDHREEPYCDHYRDHMSLISYHVNVIKTEEHRLGLENAVCSHSIGILERRVDHNHADNRSQIRIGSKRLRRRKSDEDLQEGISRIAEQTGKYINRTAGVHVDKAVIDHKIQRIHDPHKKTAGHDRRYNGYENIPQKLNGPHKYILLFGSSLLSFCLCACSNACNGYKLIKHFIDRSCSQNNLKLSGSFKNSFYSLNIFQSSFISLIVIGNNQTEPCCTVGGRNNIFASAYFFQNFLCGLSVVHDDSPFSLSFSFHDNM